MYLLHRKVLCFLTWIFLCFIHRLRYLDSSSLKWASNYQVGLIMLLFNQAFEPIENSSLIKYRLVFFFSYNKSLTNMLEFVNFRCCNPVEFVNIKIFSLCLYSKYLWPLQKKYFCDCEMTDGNTCKSLIGLKHHPIQSPFG